MDFCNGYNDYCRFITSAIMILITKKVAIATCKCNCLPTSRQWFTSRLF